MSESSKPSVQENLSRRSFLKSAAAGAAIMAAPAFISREVLASNGELNLYTWSDYVYPEMIESFFKETGIKVNLSTYGSNDEVLNRLRAARGEGFDVVNPSIGYIPSWTAQELLMEIDESKVNVAGIIPSMWESSANLGGVQNGKRYAVPFNWGTEALCIDTEKVKPIYGELGYGSLWEPAYKGLVTVRAHSGMLGMGLHLDAIGAVPSNRMLDSYINEERMREIYEQIVEFAIQQKPSIVQFWSNAQETEAAFLQNGAVIGQTWDGPAMRLRTDSDARYTYLAPKEGAMTWMDSVAIPVGAKNVDAAYAWLNWYYQPKHAAIHVRLSGYNSCTLNADKEAGEDYAKNFAAAYPENAIENLWWYPPEPAWFAPVRNDFRDRFLSA